MKVLSIQAPFATLIALGKKTIETRSWKTNYRGELYIHASGKILSKLANNNDLKKIIKNIENIKQNSQEYNLGLYEIGRYAWILENITLIEPILTKGKLNIWEYRK